MNGFTAQEALDAQGTEDAEMITWARAGQMCHEHGTQLTEFLSERSGDTGPMVDAGDLLAWLGY